VDAGAGADAGRARGAGWAADQPTEPISPVPPDDRAVEQREHVEAARLRALVGSLTVGILVQDAEGHVVQANTAFTRMFDMDAAPGALVGTSVPWPVEVPHLFVHPAEVQRSLEAAIAGGRTVLGEEVELANGRVVERDYLPVELDGANHGQLLVFRDVTGQIDRRRGLEKRNRILAELASSSTQFVAAVSHELRTPLTSIAAFADMVQESAGYATADREVAAAGISRNAERMLRLVDDLVLLANLESGVVSLKVTEIDLPRLARKAVDAARAGMGVPRRAIEHLEGHGPPLVGDLERIEQLVTVLLDAVISVTTDGAHAFVGTRYEEPQWMLEVASSPDGSDDHAMTAKAADEAPVSPPFTELELELDGSAPAALMTRGTALAFLLGRAIVACHGGELSASRTTYGGIRFLISLPVGHEHGPAGVATNPPR
jgi:PAS domain S-box-containing protein